MVELGARGMRQALKVGTMHRITRIGFLLAAVAIASGCGKKLEAERRQSAQANATAEAIAQGTSVTSITSATLDEAQGEGADVQRAHEEIIAAFRLEQGDYRARLQTALDALDKDVSRARQGGHRGDQRVQSLRDRRSLLKADLDAVDRSTEPDWATLRTKLDRELGPVQ